MKLSRKLTFSFIFAIIISILVISWISNYMINNRFEIYLIQERENKFHRIHKEINDLYMENSPYLDEMDLKHYALTEDINIIIQDTSGKVLYNSDTRGRMGMGMMGHYGGMMHGKNKIPRGNYVEQSYPLSKGNIIAGTLVIGYVDNAYLTESAIIFRETLSKSFFISGLITIIMGLIISILLSKGLSDPLVNIKNTANEIRYGNLSALSVVKSNTTEIVELSDSINYLGSTLKQQEDIRQRYASDISHELRTPLTTLQSHLEAIMDGVWEPTDEHLNILMGEISRLGNLVDDLRDSFRADELGLNLNKTKFNISKEIEDIINTFIPIFNKEGYKINYSIEENIDILMDKGKLRQIMNNLLSNSLRYLNNNGQVYINLYKSNNLLTLKIKDNGMGIKEEDLPFIFNRFYRADSSRDKSTGGTGLGLAIVKSIVEAHNGTIHINSRFGSGTEIILRFPFDSI